MPLRACRAGRVFGLRAAAAAVVLTLAWPLAGADTAGSGGQGQGANVDVVASRGTSARVAAIGARYATIIGTAWHSDDTPIPRARVRLRNVSTGRIEAHAVATELGRFEFQEVESGSYATELVDETGKVLTVGPRFTATPGDTVATFVKLGTRVPWFNGFFANAAAAVASAAAAAGVTAIAPEGIRPVSATQ